MERRIVLFLLLKAFMQSIHGQSPILHIDSDSTSEGSSFTLNCSVAIDDAITFKHDNVANGSCATPFLGVLGSCNPNIITQSIADNVTSWTIAPALIAHRGSWKCTLGTTDSNVVTLTIYKLPVAVLTQNGISSDTTVNDTSSYPISIEVGCLFSENDPTVELEFVAAGATNASASMSCSNSSTVCSACTGCSAYSCSHDISVNQHLSSGSIAIDTPYTLQIKVGVTGTTQTVSLPVFSPHSITFKGTGVSPDEKDECLNVGWMFLSALCGSMIVILALCCCCQGHKHKWKIIIWTAVLSVEYDLILALSFYNICVSTKWYVCGLFFFGGVVIALVMACIAKKAYEENGFWYYVLLFALLIIGIFVIKCLYDQLKKAEEPDDTKITNADDSSTTNGNNHECPTNIIVSTTGKEKKSLENNHERPTNIIVSTTGKENKSLEPIPGVFTQNAGNNHESPTNIIVSTTGKEKKSLEPIPGVFAQNAGGSKLNQKPFGTAVPLPSIHSSKEVNP